MNDTGEAFRAMFHQKMMEHSPEDRVQMGIRMSKTARAIATASFPEGGSEAEQRYHLFLRLYSRDYGQKSKQEVRLRLANCCR